MTDNNDQSGGIFGAANKLGGELHAAHAAQKAAEDAAKQKEQERKHQKEIEEKKKTEGLL